MTIKTNELISMVESLPVDIKTKLVEKILDSLHPSQKEIDVLWAKEAEKRIDEIGTGKVKTIPGKDVFILKKSIRSSRNEILLSPRRKERALRGDRLL